MSFESWISEKAAAMPLEIFCALGGLAEELIAPIPSAVVAVTAGSLANQRYLSEFYLLWFALWGSAGKTLGVFIIYSLSFKAEFLLTSRFGKSLGIRRRQLEQLQARLQGGWKDWVILTALRAFPLLPGALVSVASGLLKIPRRIVLITTLAGYFFRDLSLLYIGYAGKEAYASLSSRFQVPGSAVAAGMIAGLLVPAVWIYRRRKKKASQ